MSDVTGSPAYPDATARERFAWAMYDFANSGYTTVVLTAIFSAYFVGVVAGEGGYSSGAATALWTVTVAIGNAIVLATAPVVGAVADRRAAKKSFLVISTLVCVGATGALALAGAGDVALAMVLVVISYAMFATGENLISAFLPEIASVDRMGRISGYGWAIGYFGGLTTLGLCLAYITWAQGQGQDASAYVPATLVITAAVFALAASFTFAWLKERATPTALGPGETYIRAGFVELRRTLGEVHRFKDLIRFFASLLAFQAGASTVFVVAAIYAQEELGFATDELITLIMIVNVTAVVGALAIGQVQDKFSSKAALTLGLFLWIAALSVVLAAESRTAVWVGANLMGIAMGGCQAAGRALVGQFTPIERPGEFFGLWGLTVNLAAIVGPVSYGLISWLSGGNHRLALGSTLGFFVLGLVLLALVDEARGKRAAESDNSRVGNGA